MGERAGVIAKTPEVKKEISNSRMQKTARLRSMGTSADRIRFLQRTAGNRAVSKLMKSGALQAKLRIGQPGDVYEQEADRVADEVMRMPELGRLGCEEGEGLLQTKQDGGQSFQADVGFGAKIHSLEGSAQPLPRSVRDFFEPRFGHDFSQVRVHTDAKAMESARAVNAVAYTVGKDIVFGVGRYTPGTSEGRRLLAHELTHVIQQGRMEESKPMLRASRVITSPGDRFEAETNRASILVTSGEHVHISNRLHASEEMIARSDDDCPSALELIVKCGIGVIACVGTLLAGIAVSPTGIGLAAAILLVIAVCGGSGLACGELLGKYVRCRRISGSIGAGIAAAVAAAETAEAAS